MSDLLTPAQLGERWHKSTASLAQMRYRGNGPRFAKIAGSIFYRVQDVLDFEESQVRTRTDDEPAEKIEWLKDPALRRSDETSADLLGLDEIGDR